jgi:hypothetical protein
MAYFKIGKNSAVGYVRVTRDQWPSPLAAQNAKVASFYQELMLDVQLRLLTRKTIKTGRKCHFFVNYVKIRQNFVHRVNFGKNMRQIFIFECKPAHSRAEYLAPSAPWGLAIAMSNLWRRIDTPTTPKPLKM